MSKSTTGSARWLFWACKVKTGNSLSKLVLIALSDYANDAGECWPSIASLAEECECSRRTVERSLNQLEDLGHITRVHRAEDGIKQTNLYRINMHATVSRIDASESRRGSVTESHKPPIETPIVINKTSEPEIYVQFSQHMWSRIQQVTGSNREPDHQKWAKPIRLLVEKDGRDPETVRQVFDWANQHHFWSANILSAPKLRTQFDTLYSQWRKDRENTRANVQPHSDQRRLSAVDRVRQRREDARLRHTG